MEPPMNLGTLLKQINDSIERKVNNQIRDMGLTMTQSRILALLDQRSDKTASMKELEHSLGVAQSTCAGIIARLSVKGMVETFSPPDDRRSKLVRLTESGRLRCALSKAEADSSLASMQESFTPEESAELERLLIKLLRNLQ